MDGEVVAVSRNPRHRLSKEPSESIRLLAGRGVEGDAHAGETVQHRSRKRWNPGLPNLRQIHLIASELLDELRDAGFDVAPGVMGENVTTRGVDLLALPRGARVRLGRDAVVEVTGLRNPCVQLDRHQPGLMGATLAHESDGTLRRRAGVMAIVLEGGVVAAGDALRLGLPAPPHEALTPV